MKRTVIRCLSVIAISAAIAVLMMILSGVSPVSGVYSWLARKNAVWVWYGLTAGLIGLVLALYLNRRK